MLRNYTLLSVLLSFLISLSAYSTDIYVTGKITDVSGSPVANARVSMNSGSFIYTATSSSGGNYVLKVSGIYGSVNGSMIEAGTPYPNPFSFSVNVPFIIKAGGDIHFSVYSMTGQKIRDLYFPGADAGSYRIVWDGRNASGAPVRQGFYVYALSFMGKTISGRIIKAAGASSYSAGCMLEPVMIPPSVPADPGTLRIPVITTVTCDNFYSVRLTDIIIHQDTIIDFEIKEKDALPFRAVDDHIAMKLEAGYRPLILKGINLGSSPPGYFPGEIAYAIPSGTYKEWIERIGEAGFNSLRIYTLHPPAFYEALSNYNQRHPDNPVLLFQGIWLNEVEDGSDPDEYDLLLRIPSFRSDIGEVIDCIHGSRDIAFRAGRAYGSYLTDVSRWTAGFIIGREISSQEVDSTNSFHPALSAYSGNQFSIEGGSASEVFAAQMLDETVGYENLRYGSRRPVSISSWPTLDPLSHPTEVYTDEDRAFIDIYKLSGKTSNAGLFATYHAYPYYPNFVSLQPSYQAFSDSQGRNSYLGYLNDLKDHYPDIPLVIGEFGVPSSWGSAHQSFSNMHHGGYSEIQQGEKNLRMMHNIVDAGCAGGFMFAWMDEWFKRTWIVQYLEAYGVRSGEVTIPTRQLWLNLASPEQNFGLLGYQQKEVLPFVSYMTDNPAGHVKKSEATNDNCFFYLNAELDQALTTGDTIMVAFDTYSSSTGESRLPNGKNLPNRSEFLFTFVAGQDTGFHHVTQAYDMNGLTPRFNLSDPVVQRYRSTSTDGDPWIVMQWKNDGSENMEDNLGRVPVENSTGFTPGLKTAAAWSGNKIRIRIPWTLLYFFDPTQMIVNDGAESYDGGWNYEISVAESDGIAVSVYYKGSVTSSTTRYNWAKWLVVPATDYYEKESLHVVEAGLASFPAFAD